jgi:hypothetical protein
MFRFLELFGGLVTLYVDIPCAEVCQVGTDKIVRTVMGSVVMCERISCHLTGLARDSAGCSEV